MQQFAVTCPKCIFVLRFHDSKLLGRKGRCPACRHKFILTETERPASSAAGVRTAASPPTIRSKTKAERVDSTTGVASSPTTAKDSAAKPRATASQNKGGPRWKADFQRGLGSRRPTLSARWVLPDVLTVSTVTVISLGAIIGASIAEFVVTSSPETVSALPAVLRGEMGLPIAAAVGGAVAACCLVRRHDPLQPDRTNDDRQEK